ncbi:MAG: HEAT repeat domain-containing protein, partial [Myxococcales bacterium]|nr:HEAT repeat domain-containing protein [Myxococcales bacterium]
MVNQPPARRVRALMPTLAALVPVLLLAATPRAELDTYVDALKTCDGLADRGCLLAATRLKAEADDVVLPRLGAALPAMNRPGQLVALSVIDGSTAKAATELLAAAATDARLDPATRALAVDDLGDRTFPKLVDVLLAARRDADPMVRVAATRALANRLYRGDKRILGALRDAAADESAAVRVEAIFGLAFSHDPAVALDLLRALDDAEPGVRRAAAEGLAVVKHQAAPRRLVAHLRDDDAMLVRAVMRALRFQTNAYLDDDPAAWERWWE